MTRLTLIAGTRLWAHIFWRQGPEGKPSAILTVKPLGHRGIGFGLVPASVLVAAILVASFWPGLPVSAANRAAAGLIDPTNYIAAAGLEERP